MMQSHCFKKVFLGIVVFLTQLIFGLYTPYALGAPAGSLPVSKGVYRLPYQNGTELRLTRDHTNHSPLNRLDIKGINESGDYVIVASGSGRIRRLVDTNTLGSCSSSDAGCANNYIWIEHSNGEWTKYSHLRPNSATNLGRFVGEFVTSGTPLGIEDDIGFASGPHLHFEVVVPNDPSDPFNNGGFIRGDGDSSTTDYNRQNRIPVFCDIGVASTGIVYEAANCQPACASIVTVANGVADNSVRHRQADNQVRTVSGNTHIVRSGGGEALRAGQRVTLFPGFQAENGSYFSASIGSCDRPGAN